jgi:glycine/D-amino acid oxidase-like deaminating enzyme
MINGQISFWLSGPESPTPPPTDQLLSDISVDVAIVGGGVTGLWTAWALSQAEPSWRIAVFEAERLGFGASGRNGGLLSSKTVGSRKVLAKAAGGREAVMQTEKLVETAMHDVVNILGADNIHAHHGGWLQVARTPSELARLRKGLQGQRSWGIDELSLRLLAPDEVTERIRVDKPLGALYSPDNYAVDPARMVFELAKAVMALGVQVYTNARATDLEPGALLVAGRRVRARSTVIATEGYTAAQSRHRRSVLPINSSQLVTEPLTDAQWDEIGWGGYESLAGAAHTFFYSKRTHDGRIAIGGRGHPYRFGSGFDTNGIVDPETVDDLMSVLSELFPQISVTPAHAWCGVLGVARDWSPFVDYDRGTRTIRVGGYVGQGLAAALVAGRTCADLLLGRDTSYTQSPWVRPMPRRWEPEPLRWIGATGIYRAYSWADERERRSTAPKTSVLARIADKAAQR